MTTIQGPIRTDAQGEPNRLLSGALLAELFERAESAQFIFLRDGALVAANRRARDLSGLAAADGVPRELLQELFAPAAARRVRELIHRQHGRAELVPLGPRASGGAGDTLVEVEVRPLGQEFAWVTLHQCRAEMQMESHLHRLATAINSTTDVVFLTDSQGRLTFVNNAFQLATGYTLEDALGRTPDFLRHAGQEARLGAAARALERGHSWTGEWLNRRRDGAVYPVESTTSPVYDRRGALLGWVTVERDITLKRRLEAELRAERDYALSILESIDSAVYALDGEFRLTHVTDRWRRLPAEHGCLNFRQPPQAGRTLLDYVADQDRRAALRKLLALVLATGEPQELEATSADQRRWHVKIAPWKRGSAVVGLLYVVTERTQLHELQRQLFQAQKMETIGALAAGIAHDFNNLLMAIRGNVELLFLSGQVPDSVRGRLQKIVQASSRAADITRQLLAFSRPGDEQETVVDLNSIIREAVQLAQRSLQANVVTQLRLAEQPMPVRLDGARAQQIFLNLCVNAQDAMPNGGTLTLATDAVHLTPEQAAKIHQTPGAPFVRCSVADTGTGMTPEVLARIFDPFFTTKGQGKGTGLGLSIVHTIVGHAGGLIEVDTQVGHGTTFRVYLPRVEGRGAAAAPADPLALRRGRGRVLVVDDQELVLDFTSSFMRETGYEVLVAPNAEKALETLERENERIDVLFTDLNMTGKNGLQLVREVAARWPKVKCVLASGYLEPAAREQLEQQYGARVLHKPFHVQEATQLVAELLGQQ